MKATRRQILARLIGGAVALPVLAQCDAASPRPRSEKRRRAINASPATIADVIRRATGGETIRLTGRVPLLAIVNRSFSPPITITGGTIGQINLSNCQGIAFSDVEVAFAPTARTKAWDAAVRFYQCRDVTLTGSRLRGAPAVNGVAAAAARLDATGNVRGMPCGRGIFLHLSSGITIERCDIARFQNGIVLNKVERMTIARNDIHDTRSSSITGGEVGTLRIEGNRLRAATPWRWSEPAGDHGDFIHLFSAKGAAVQRDIAIERNFIEQLGGTAMLGINVGDPAGVAVGFENVAITDNVICNANHQAIRVENVKGRVAHNTMVTPVDVHEPNFSPGVIVRTGSVIALEDNLLGQISIDATSRVKQSGNVLIKRADYARTFVNALARDPTLEDFAVRPGVTAGARIGRKRAEARGAIGIGV